MIESAVTLLALRGLQGTAFSDVLATIVRADEVVVMDADRTLVG